MTSATALAMMDWHTATPEKLLERISKLESDIDHLSRHDQLTGLLGRTSFVTALDHQQGHNQDARGALVAIAVRGIPRISGTLGRHVGDYVIAALAARLNALALPNSTMCRLDHNHYAIYLASVAEPLEAMSTAKNIINILSQPVDWVDRKLNVEVAAGVALTQDNPGDGTNLIHNAELALKSATLRGGPGYAFFNPALAQAAKRRNDILLELQTALEDQTLRMHYQPFFTAENHRLTGFESLIRFNSAALGEVTPAEFIPVAEESGLIGKIGAWALAEACRAASTWPQDLTVAVNISPEQFHSGSLVTDVHNALELSSFPAYRLELEITESTLLKDSESVLTQLSTLREMGCAIVLDDFGTGYSSLSYLWKFPFSKLKIDRAFVVALDTTPLARGILQSIIGLARNIGIKVTAEGIETKTHMEILRELGANMLQGFYLGRPQDEMALASTVLQNAKLTPTKPAVRQDLFPPLAQFASGN